MMASSLKDELNSSSKSDDGAITVDFMLVLPVFLLFLGALVHAAFIYRGHTAVLAAAQDGAATAAYEYGTESDGVTVSTNVLSWFPYLENKQVQVIRGRLFVKSSVSATVVTPILDINSDVSAEVIVPVERYVIQTERE